MKKHKKRKWAKANEPVITPSRTLHYFLTSLEPHQRLFDCNGNPYTAKELLEHNSQETLNAPIERVTVGVNQLLFYVLPDGTRQENPLYGYQ